MFPDFLFFAPPNRTPLRNDYSSDMTGHADQLFDQLLVLRCQEGDVTA
jgi:hypothetical protein